MFIEFKNLVFQIKYFCFVWLHIENYGLELYNKCFVKPANNPTTTHHIQSKIKLCMTLTFFKNKRSIKKRPWPARTGCPSTPGGLVWSLLYINNNQKKPKNDMDPQWFP